MSALSQPSASSSLCGSFKSAGKFSVCAEDIFNIYESSLMSVFIIPKNDESFALCSFANKQKTTQKIFQTLNNFFFLSPLFFLRPPSLARTRKLKKKLTCLSRNHDCKVTESVITRRPRKEEEGGK